MREVGHFHVNAALQEAHRLASQPGWFCPSQFDSADNVEENRLWLGPEILEQLPAHAPPDALVLGVGTGGTWWEWASPSVRPTRTVDWWQ